MKEISPIDLRMLKQIIPDSYTQSLHQHLFRNEESSDKNLQRSPEIEVADLDQSSQAIQEEKQEELSPPKGNENHVNQINTNTFQQIAMGLSPDPQKLMQQQASQQATVKVGQKRPMQSIYEEAPTNKKQKLFAEAEPEENGEGLPNLQEVDTVLQGLMQQVQQSASKPVSSAVQSPTKTFTDGVKIGGFRTQSYSDSHQDIVKTVSRLSAEDIKLIERSASKKEAIDMVRARMISL